MDQRVSVVTLGVTDLLRAKRFYETLGWTVGLEVPGDVVFFQAGGLVVALWGREALAADSGVADGGPGAIALAHNVRSPTEVDAVIEEARAAGADVRREGAPTEWGGYSALFADLDGHRWEIAHNPAWPIAADGTVSLP